jgi:uroporphyrinogen III methyltransferase/synthase
VVRLKGGDPSLFGRLSEEIGPLHQHNLLFKVLPGIPWICSAPIRHGIYLTNRQEVRHFQVATGTEIEGKAFNTRDLDPSRGPIYFFMSLNKLGSIVSGLIESGYDPNTPCAIFREDPGEENIIQGNLSRIEENLKNSQLTPPGIFLVGISADRDHRFSFSEGPLSGKRILCPGSESSRSRLSSFIQALGGLAIPIEVFKLQQTSSTSWLQKLSDFDYLVLASGSAVEIMIQLLKQHNIDLRKLPPIAVSGPSAAKALKAHGLYPDFMANTFTSESLGLELIRDRHLENKNILVARSDASKSPLPNMLKEAGANVHIETLYENRACEIEPLPKHDAICFCSPSSVEVIWNAQAETLKQSPCIASIGPVTSRALKAKGLKIDLEPNTYDAQHLIWALASKLHWS